MLPFLLLIAAGSGGNGPTPGIPSVQDLKDYLRIEIDAEDELLADLLLRAQQWVESVIDLPITAEAYTFKDRASTAGGGGPARALVSPRRPIGESGEDPLVVTDGDGTVVAASTYELDGEAGMIYGKAGTRFWNGPYTVNCLVGLSLWSRFDRMTQLLESTIIDVAADLYQRRSPLAVSETGGGTTVTWDVSRETAKRVQTTLRALRLPVAI